MTKLSRILLILSACIVVLAACNTKTQVPKTILCGIITGPNDTYATIKNENFSDTIEVDNSGAFHIDLSIESSGYLVFAHGKEITTMFLEPGDSVYLTINTAEFDESVTYSGTGAEKNNYLAKNFLEEEKQSPDFYMLFSLPVDSFTAFVDSVMTSKINAINEYTFEEDFMEAQRTGFLLDNSVSKFIYPSYHEYFTSGEKVELPQDWYDFISLIDINDDLIKTMKSYNTYLDQLIGYEAENLLADDSVLASRSHKETLSSLMVINNIIDNVESRNDLLYQYMNEHVMYNSINDIGPLLKDFENLCSDSLYTSKIKTEIAKWDALKEGNVAPVFTASDLEGKNYSLTDFLGKYVYVDVWATWCGPCKREIPYLKSLIDEFAGKNVVFMSVSVDNTQEPWREMLSKDDDVHGMQLYAEGAWKSSLATDYLVRSIPRFILIDREGKIIDVNAPRPSENINEVLSQLEGI